MASNCRHFLEGESQRQAVMWTARIAPQLLMTPAVPLFFPSNQRQGLTLGPSHIFSHDPPFCPRFCFYTHTQTWVHMEGQPGKGRGREGGRLSGGHGTNSVCSQVTAVQSSAWEQPVDLSATTHAKVCERMFVSGASCAQGSPQRPWRAPLGQQLCE